MSGSKPKKEEPISLERLRQGALIETAGLDEKVEAHIKESRAIKKYREKGVGDYLLLLSQDCDIASCSNSYIEILAVKLKKPEKAPNQLQVPRDYGKIYLRYRGGFLECKADLISVVEKSQLEGPLIYAGHLDDRSVRIMRDWRAGRYTRAPFPDGFNSVFVPFLRESGLNEFLEQHYTDIEDLWVYVYPEEENAARYDVSITAQISPECNPQDEETIEAYLKKSLQRLELEAARLNLGQFNNNSWLFGFPNCTILVTADGADITLEDLATLRRFNTDYLCYPEQESGQE